MGRETWQQVCDRTIAGISKLGKFTMEETELLREMQESQKVLPSGRWLWVGGTDWIEQPKNYSGAYNCTSTNVVDWDAFALMMDLAMMGSGTGAMLEDRLIKNLPAIRNKLKITTVFPCGVEFPQNRIEETAILTEDNYLKIIVGDSRSGWVSAYLALLQASTDETFDSMTPIQVEVDCRSVRPAGERLQGFGGTSNPAKLEGLFDRLAAILNKAQGRQLTSVECCLIIDEAASVVVAGNIRRSAGMRQFSRDDAAAATAKDNLWQQDDEGNWRIDPERDALRMANHTRCFHTRPSLDEVSDAVTKQFYSGEGAIQFVPEAVARANRDILNNTAMKERFIELYTEEGREIAAAFLHVHRPGESFETVLHRMNRFGLNPCGEIIGVDFHCNLSEVHLNQLDPNDRAEQDSAFRAAGLAVAALLHHRFEVARYRESRELDPIVGVSFTGLFDFFVHALGTEWLQWFAQGRPDSEVGKAFKKTEESFLTRWRIVVEKTVREYCGKHGLKVPNRCTTVQPAGTKSLLTGASSGWHPPKAARFIRRITFRKNDPVALACMDYGYNVIPSQSDKDEEGKLLNNPFDTRCTEWLVEIPTEVSWANIPGADQIDISKFSALAQFDFYMQVQKFYTTHNTSATIEYREDEIANLSKRIHKAITKDEGYISAALLARFDSLETFPRLPFEPISKEEYLQLNAEVSVRQRNSNFYDSLVANDEGELIEAGPAGCDGDKCLFPGAK